ncbi:MAG: hypothetical protein F4Z01_06915 [Gammaproteobacteria bacterium]|nr:hypothetical protein [Gammaproteobacteria bacterium]
MRIRNNEEITFQEAVGLLASRNGRENLQRKIDTLEYLLSRDVELEPFKQKPEPLREPQPASTECAECGENAYSTGRLDLCQDCYDAIANF